MSPSCRQASGDQDAGPRGFVRHLELLPRRPRIAQPAVRGLRVALEQQHRALRIARQRVQQRRVEIGGQLRQLVCGGARGEDVTGGDHDLDVRRQQPGPRHASLGAVHHPADRRPGRVGLSLDQAQPCQAGLRLPAPPAGLAVPLLGLRELAAEPVQLGLLVEGGTDRRLSAREEPLTRTPRRAARARPLAVQLHDLGAMDQAVAAERDQVRLRVAPVGQCRRPLLRPAQIEDLLACLDHAAVDRAGDDLGHLVGHDGDHDLVEQRHARGRVPLRDQRAALDVAGERHQVDVTEPQADLDGPAGDRVGVRPVSLERALEGHRDEQVPLLRAVVPDLVDQPPCAREPAAGAGELAAVQQDEDQPARAAGGPLDLAPFQLRVMGTLPRRDARLVPTDQIRGHREPLDVLGLERGGPIRRRQFREGIGPRPAAEALATTRASLAVTRHEGILRLSRRRDRAVTPRCRRNSGRR